MGRVVLNKSWRRMKVWVLVVFHGLYVVVNGLLLGQEEIVLFLKAGDKTFLWKISSLVKIVLIFLLPAGYRG